MNLNYSDEQVMLREQIQKFCETEYDFYNREDIVKSDEVWSRKVLALWRILQTYSKMKEYPSIGFKNHPSISLEYARFLVQNTSLERVTN